MRKALRYLLALSFMMSLFVAAIPVQAATFDVGKVYKIVNRHSGKALDVYNWSTADGGNVVQWADLGGLNQQWRIVSLGSGNHKIVNAFNSKALEVYNWSTADGANVAQWKDWNGASQQWRIVDLGNGYFKIVNRHSGKALEVYNWSIADGGNVVQWTDWGGASQQWRIVEVRPSQTITVNSTIVVPAGQTFDGQGRRYVANASTLGDGGQSENQKAVFRLENGATLKNVVLGAPAADGVHTYGNALVENVVWEDVGEDALTIKSTGRVIIRGGSAQHAYDKIFQVNAPATLEIHNFTAINGGKLVRQVGGSTFHVDLIIDGSVISGMKESIFRTDSATSRVTMTNTYYSNIRTKWYNVRNVSESNNTAF